MTTSISNFIFPLFSFFLFFFFFPTSSSALNNGTTVNHEIWKACKATRHPGPCQTMLTQSGRVKPGSSPTELVRAALHVAGERLETGEALVGELLKTSDPNKTKIAEICLDSLEYARIRARDADDAVMFGRMRDARAWGSCALNFEYGCWGGMRYVNNTPAVNKTLWYFERKVIVSMSNALSMMRAIDALGLDTAKWASPRTERDGYWEPVVGPTGLEDGFVGSGFKLATLKENVTVCKSGGCDHTTVQDAVDAAPENLKKGEKYVIRIKEGVYEEIVRVLFVKKNLVFLGDGMGKTVITGSLNYGLMGINTFHTATVGVLADGFMASGLTIQNTAGAGAQQAVAFRSDSDFSYLENCELLGNQDTLYAHSLRQLYSNCVIQGNVDFIFGNAAAIFQNCTILVRPLQQDPQNGGSYAITAHGRSDPAQTTGFAFVGCHIDGTPEYLKLYNANPKAHKNYLGRPWKMYSRTVFVKSTMGEIIHPEGWMPWDGDFALSTVYYGEYGNSGSGANRSKRVPWSRLIPAEHIATFTVQNFLQGDEWITKTNS